MSYETDNFHAGDQRGPRSRDLFSLASRWEAMYAQQHAHQFHWYIQGAPEQLERHLKDSSLPVGPALDVGCGFGEVTSLLWQAEFRPAVGFDISMGAVLQAKEFAATHGTKPDLAVAAVPHFPFRDRSFSFVYDRGCLHALSQDEYEDYACEVARVLFDGGHCLLIERSEAWKHFKMIVPQRFELLSREKLILSAQRGVKGVAVLLRKKPEGKA